MLATFIKKIIAPRQKDEDVKRREFILNILLVPSICLLLLANIIYFFDKIFLYSPVLEKNSAPLVLIIGSLSLLVGLYVLSRKGYIDIAAYIFVIIYCILAIYLSVRYGVNVEMGLLFNVLCIVMSGVLISAKFAIILAAAESLFISVINYLHSSGVIVPLTYWRTSKIDGVDVMIFCAVFFIVAIVSWLSNREIEKSLKRARASEAALAEERDMLEIRVEERTRDLKQAQMEKIVQLSRFAEMGRMSVGLFHDIVNPLTAVMLGVEKIKRTQASGGDGCKLIEADLERTAKTTERIGKFIVSIKKQISGDQKRENFSINQEIKDAIQLMSYLARQADVTIVFSENKEIFTYGSSVKLSQMIVNLLANAVDSFAPMNPAETGKIAREIMIRLIEEDGVIILTIADNGRGIPQDIREKIFEPFFSTKDPKHGTGIGLSMVKSVVEADCGGTITFETEENKGTKFIIKFPKKYEPSR